MTDMKKRGFFGRLAGLAGSAVVLPAIAQEPKVEVQEKIVEKVVYVPTNTKTADITCTAGICSEDYFSVSVSEKRHHFLERMPNEEEDDERDW